MSLNEFNRPLRLSLKPSQSLKLYLGLLHILALFSLVLANLAIFIKLGIGLIIIISLYCSCRKFFSFGKTGNEWIWLDESDWIEKKADRQVWWQYSFARMLTDWLVIITLKNLQGKKRVLLILRDQVDAHYYRRLLVRLRYTQVEATVNEDSLA